jgi:hypothetical protein
MRKWRGWSPKKIDAVAAWGERLSASAFSARRQTMSSRCALEADFVLRE